MEALGADARRKAEGDGEETPPCCSSGEVLRDGLRLPCRGTAGGDVDFDDFMLEGMHWITTTRLTSQKEGWNVPKPHHSLYIPTVVLGWTRIEYCAMVTLRRGMVYSASSLYNVT